MRTVGVVSRGVRCPVVKQGDDMVQIATEAIVNMGREEHVTFHEKDIVAVTEAVVARTQGNYATTDDIAACCRSKFDGEEIGITFPILSRNRISVCLKGIAKAFKKAYILMSYPSDEVGNQLFDEDLLDEKGVDPYRDVLTEERYRELFGYTVHPFTGVDYVEFYKELFKAEGCETEFIFANDVRAILSYTDQVLCCDIHSRERSRRRLTAAGARRVLTLADIMAEPVGDSGYNESYGLYGSNKATEDSVKLFPRDCQSFVDRLQASLEKATGVKMNCMIYGDGAFKDPMGKIWELADPVVSPAYTEGLSGRPNELKLKYLADTEFKDLKGEELNEAMKEAITKKEADLVGVMKSEGTTPRRLTDLIGSLCDLTSGSGDKGTPIVFIQGYFDTFAVD